MNEERPYEQAAEKQTLLFTQVVVMKRNLAESLQELGIVANMTSSYVLLAVL